MGVRRGIYVHGCGGGEVWHDGCVLGMLGMADAEMIRRA